MADDAVLQDKTIALVATDGFEDSELTQPLDAIRVAGANVIVIADKEGNIIGKNGTEIPVGQVVNEVSAEDFDGLLLPGGVANPDRMRMNQTAVDFVRSFFDQHKPVAAICHAPWLLIEAGVVEGRTLTSWPSLKTDIINAGGTWVDQAVVTDHGLVTSRKPDDLDQFCPKAIEEFAEGVHEQQTT